MRKKEKLIDRFLSVPADFTWDELLKVLSTFGYKEMKSGKTSGSGRKFNDINNNLILLHKPHPAKIVKKYAIRQIIENLKEKGIIKDE